MSALASPVALSPSLLRPVVNPLGGRAVAAAASGEPGVADTATRKRAKDVADQFESQFLSQMIGQMFEGVSTDGAFGGGFGEQMWRSMMTDAMAKQMTHTGGVGVSGAVQREILKMQGLT